MEISLAGDLACGTTGAVCAADGRRLASDVRARSPGPEPAPTGEESGGTPDVPAAALPVADASAHEGGTLDVVVTLGYSGNAAMTVDYATSDDTATAGEDHTAVWALAGDWGNSALTGRAHLCRSR